MMRLGMLDGCNAHLLYIIVSKFGWAGGFLARVCVFVSVCAELADSSG